MDNENRSGEALQAYYSATGFLDTAENLFSTGKKDAAYLFTCSMYPLTVNASFACELYIKAILILNNLSYRHIHELKSIYSMLPEKVKESIEQAYSACGQSDSVDSILEKYNTAFINWRYPFDTKSSKNTLVVAWTSLLCFAGSLKEECEKCIENAKSNIDNTNLEAKDHAD